LRTLKSIGKLRNLQVFIGAVSILIAWSAGPVAAQDVNTIVSNMVRAQRANRAQHTAYEVVRNYQVFKPEHPDDKSKVVAEVDFLPPGAKSFKIMQSSGGMVEHVVRKSLEHEVELTQDPSRTEYSPANYDFALVGQEVLDGNPCFVLSLKPKHDSKDLLDGNAWVDAKSFLIRKVEGSPSKSLSFWLKDVRLTFRYQDVDGMWLRTSSRASAHVRFSGEMDLISRDVNFRSLQDNNDVATAAPTPVLRATHYSSQMKARRNTAANNYREQQP
jgi:hypothetical protein